MGQMIRTRFLPLILAGCLAVGVVANLVSVQAPLIGVLIAVMSVLVWVVIRLVRPFIERLTPRKVSVLIGAALVVMVVIQCLVLIYMPVTVYHDPYRVLSQADQMAAGHYTWNITYFWRYPNNVPLAWMLSWAIRCGWLVGLTTNGVLHVLSLLFLDGLIVLTLRTVRQVHARNTAVVGLLALFTLTPFAYTYFLQVFYSDLPALLCLVVIVRTFLFWPKWTLRHRLINGVLLLLVTLFGQITRPNLIIIIPALVVVALVVGVSRWRGHHLMWPSLMVAAGIALSFPATAGIQRLSNFQNNNTYVLPTTSWVMMGLNPGSRGKYSGHDVGREINLPSKAARQRYALKTIQQRITRLGPIGLVKHWFVKMGILLNGQDIQDWYNGGYRAAPGWYLRHAGTIRVVLATVNAVALIELFVALIGRLIDWRPDFGQGRTSVALLAVVIALGYLAFHTLVWETETRYGAVIWPMLWLLLALVPAKQREVVTTHTVSWWVPTVLALAGVGGLAGGSALVAHRYPENLIVAAQRSQLSTQYNARPAVVRSGSVLVEDVDLHDWANYFSVQAHLGAHVSVTISKVGTGETYHFYRAGQVYRLRRHLSAGRYQIQVVNNQPTPQSVDIIRTYGYRMAQYPLIMDGRQYDSRSLIFTSMQKHVALKKATVISPKGAK